MPEIEVAPVKPDDLPDVLALNARAFGPGRFARSAYRVREGTQPISRFCLLARIAGEPVAAVRFTEITIGGRQGALLLGPLAVEERYSGLGYGQRLIADGIRAAKEGAIKLVVLVGDESYYGRFGFKLVPPGQIQLPGPVDPRRLLAAECEPDVLASYSGLIEPERE